MQDLLALDTFRPPRPSKLKPLRGVTTPLRAQSWSTALADHPDPDLRRFIVAGLTHGFRIGFDRSHPLRSACRNMPSAQTHAAVVDEYLAKERSAGSLIGPIPAAGLHTNRFGVIPKGHTPGKWRLITDLSFPPGYSVNDGIDPGLCSMSYITVDAVARTVASLGPRALMAKVDIKAVYWLIPVHPDDRPLLAVQWRGETFCHGALPFGLGSAPKIFNAVADALDWCIKQQGASLVEHYLDDYIIWALQPQCNASLTSKLSRGYAAS